MTENWKNLQLKFFEYIWLSLGLHKGRPSYRRSLEPSIKTFRTSKHEISELFVALWVIFSLLDPDPDSESRSGSTDLIEFGSVSETLIWRRNSPVMFSLLLRKQYVGKTQQSLRERHYGHRQDQAQNSLQSEFYFQCSGSVTFWYGSGSSDPCHRLTDPNVVLLFSSKTFKMPTKK